MSSDTRGPLFRDTPAWYLGTGAYWFATSFKWFILFLLLPLQVRGLVASDSANKSWGIVVALGAIEAMIGPALFGYLSDRTVSRWGRRRPYLAIGAALTALALLFMGKAGSLWMMILGYLFLQVSDDVATGPYASIVPDVVPEEHRGRASGFLSMLQLIAQVVAAVIGIALAKDPFLIYIVIAGINLVCAAIVLRTVRERAADRKSAPAAGASFSIDDWIKPWRSADFRKVWFTRFLVALGFYILTNYAVNYMTDVVKVFTIGPLTLKSPLQAAIVVVLAMSLAGAAVTPAAGRWTDTLGRRRVIVVSGWVMFAALVPFALLPYYPVVCLLALVFGAAYGAYLSASWALASDVLPSQEDSAKDMGIWQASVATPQIISGAAGFLIDQGNKTQGGLGYRLGFLLASCAFLAGCLLVKTIKGSR